MSIEERFWSKVDRRGPDECWPWLASTVKGYGQFFIRRNKRSLAHRFAYEALVGLIPEGLQIDHQCHNRAAAAGECDGGDGCAHRRCVNPAHMEPTTATLNVLRGLSHSAANARKTRCHRGHPFDEENTLVDTNGARQCRACGRLRKGLSEVKVHGVPKTHCPQGHEMTEANTYVHRGHRGCRACRNEASKRYRLRKRVA